LRATVAPALRAAPPIPTARGVAEVREIYHHLARLPALAPDQHVNQLFGRLVSLVVGMGVADAHALVEHPIVTSLRPHLQALCATGETELERVWAARIADHPRPDEELARFPYLDNYRRLTALEWSLVSAATPRPPRGTVFIGSGPLPLSALLLARDHGIAVHGLDRDPQAVAQARRVLTALGAQDVTVSHADARCSPDLRRYDVVVLAALVGMTGAAKRAVIGALAQNMRPGSLLVARSAHSARSLLYPVLDLDALDGLDLVNVSHPYDDIVNSIVLARRPIDPPRRPSKTPPATDEVVPWRTC
jgi:predicted O-methyltransferase YrrM